MKKIILFILLVLGINVPSLAYYDRIDLNNKNVSCYVLYVIDGDTIQCDINNVETRVRLANIDAPEKKQKWGQESKNYLKTLVNNHRVILSYRKKDKYNRLLGELFLPNQRYSVNYLMVKTGNAHAYKKYIKDKAYIRAENIAKSNHLGLWRFNKVEAPENYRKKHRKNKSKF